MAKRIPTIAALVAIATALAGAFLWLGGRFVSSSDMTLHEAAHDTAEAKAESEDSRLREALERIETGVQDVQARTTIIQSKVQELDVRQARVEVKVDDLTQDVADLQGRKRMYPAAAPPDP